MTLKQKIIKWISKQVKQAGSKGVVLGLSGGLDSAVSAALCAQALSKNKVLGLILLCSSQKEDLRDACLVAGKLKIRSKTVDLTGLYAKCLKILPRGSRLSCGNLKARLRMAVLYYFANSLDCLVCGTSNKSERLTGYFTKYGDGAADILPLGNLLKTQVKELARSLNLPAKIINKAPTAGLWPGQTDEEELGITYSQLDNILSGRSSKIKSPSLIKKVRSRIQASEHKRQLPKIFKIQ
ncbi:MAG: NAD(+) synthase [Candidatus Omnitrophica bacterium]|nr:NAD(+) synthase [Candidatus Omnitrophota bacterium]